MTLDQFQNFLIDKKKLVDQLKHRDLPIKVGRLAKDHFQDNFRRQGFVDGGLHTWPKTKRQLSGNDSAASQYGALLSGRNQLFGAISYTPGDARVLVFNRLVYAPIHNWGGTIHTHPTVTPQMRKMAWARFYKAGGGKNKQDPPEARKWRALALTKKQTLNITARIPQRQFLGPSRELTKKINEIMDRELKKIIGI